MAEEQNLSQFNRFLINNRDFLIQKHTQYFTSTPPPTLKTLKTESLIDYIYDIFSFNKYRKDPKTHEKISKSLLKNINDFIRESKSKQNQVFTSQKAIQALTYCIQHNDMFSVQYDIEKPVKNTQLSRQEAQKSNNKQKKLKQTSKGIKPQNTLVSNQQQQKIITKTISNKSLNKSQDQIYVNITKLGVQIQNRHQNTQIAEAEENVSVQSSKKPQPNQFDYHQKISLNFNPQIIKKNAKIAFHSFCKNQMQLGGHRTFDNLEEDASTMTIGKLLVYAKAYNMLNQIITKQYLMQRFKRISDGKRAIDFDKFYILLTQLHIMDPDLFNRLQLMDQNLYNKLKFVKYPFYTKDQNPRELITYRSFMNKLTSHSGKTQEQLRQQINTRKLDQMNPLSKIPVRSLNRSVILRQDSLRQREKLLSPKDLTAGVRSRDFSIQLSFIDKIVSPEDNDPKYLGEYEIQHLKKHNNQQSLGNSSNISLRRKNSIVQNIKKRIQQIQNIQNGSYIRKSTPRRRYLAY